MDVSPTPTNRQRSRRSDRYREESGVAPSSELMQRTAPEAPPKPYYVPTPPPIYDESAAPSKPRSSRAKNAVPKAPSPSRAPVMMDEPALAVEEAAPARMPWQLVTALVLTFLLALGLITAQALMQAYLKTQADEREAAHQRLLDYYHVQESADGAARITYQGLIEQYANACNLQPAYVAAIIRNESSFRTDAESSVGARGLMQLMPDTAEWIAGKLGIRSFSFDTMYDAETNIRFGTWYLNYLSNLFRGDPVLVTAAYHAGQTTVTQWLSNRSMSPDGRTIPLDNLMDGPTKTYAGRVTQAYGIYQALLYPDEPLPEGVVTADGTDAPAAAPTSFIQR
ncbi:MAG: transglycosylase SLT domain-containing protein [Christensenellaceae bacterium]|nr:transglycosylase SLT domain-containing protein [Christensenellaceae bacterium]